MSEIKQIIPANNWVATFNENGEGKVKHLICWALLDNGEVVGMTTSRSYAFLKSLKEHQKTMITGSEENFVAFEYMEQR